ncbi:LuxR C-terminal-related transcriptional regulator [Daejeonella lutea]|uniref:LuxR C-terminal-related transcriptional regulator n=1 Tax=Daejeonella lutea TaxID=572036 RepID=UPI0009A66C52|nr:response regulator transcription factor [Daejeonella lutea]
MLSFADLQGFNYSELRSKSGAKILVMASLDPDYSVVSALHPGADGYVLATDPVEELVLAITRLAEGKRFLASSIGFALLTPERWKQLSVDRVHSTSRELEILNLIGDGLTNQEIADRLFTSKRTVEGHRGTLLQKTGARNSAALIKFAMAGKLMINE